MKSYGTINNIDGGARNDYTCYMCELMRDNKATVQSWSGFVNLE